MMADIPKVKRNIQRMIDQGAPESDIDAYVASEGVGLADLQAKAEPTPAGPTIGTGEDMAKSYGTGLAEGAIGLAAMPWDLDNLARRGAMPVANFIRDKIGLEPIPEDVQKEVLKPGPLSSPAWIKRLEENVTGPLHEPQTTAGEYARTFGQVTPGVFGPGGMARNALSAGVGALTSETAAQLPGVKGTELEPWVRGAVGLGSVGATSALTGAPRTAETVVAGALRGADRAAIGRAQTLMDDAERMGVPLTWDEAIQQVTNNGTRLSDLRRVVENSRGGGDVLKPIMAERPGQVAAAGDREIGAIAPTPVEPVFTGTRTNEAAQGEIRDVQANINAATRPAYQAAETQRVGPQVHAALMDDPLYEQTLNEIRNTPALNRTVAHLPDDSVGVIDLVQRRLRETAENARQPGQAHTSNLIAGNLEDARTPALEAATTATGGPRGPYAVARQAQETLRHNYLTPLNEGPVGALSRTTDAQAQGRALLPNAPAAGSEARVAETVQRLARRDPLAVENLIHQHVRGVFDEATQNLAPGPNQFGGARFAAQIAGNSQQARNLEAAVRALPNGDARWQGFRNFLDVLEATGKRPQQGSATAFNQAIQDDLKGAGGVVRTGAAAAASGGTTVPRLLGDWLARFNMGRNTEAVARLLTNRHAGAVFERMAEARPGTTRSVRLATQLVITAGEAGNREREGRR